MMRRIKELAAILCLCAGWMMALNVSAEECLVYDHADLLSVQEEEYLENLAAERKEQWNMNFLVVTIDLSAMISLNANESVTLRAKVHTGYSLESKGIIVFQSSRAFPLPARASTSFGRTVGAVTFRRTFAPFTFEGFLAPS